VSNNRFHAREAAAALLKMAKATSDPSLVAGLVDAAANLQAQAGELPPAITQPAARRVDGGVRTRDAGLAAAFFSRSAALRRAMAVSNKPVLQPQPSVS
jgi:hypothetical protein